MPVIYLRRQRIERSQKCFTLSRRDIFYRRPAAAARFLHRIIMDKQGHRPLADITRADLCLNRQA
jgi:hypothetical protein